MTKWGFGMKNGGLGMTNKGAFKVKMLKVVVLIIFIIVVIVATLLNNQRQIIREAQMVQAMGKPLMAISLYERVLLNYVPFSPYNGKAIGGIEKICLNLTDKKYKLFCEETLRSSLYQIRSFYIPYSEKIKETEKRIFLLKTELYVEHNNPPEREYEKIYTDLKNMMEYEWYPSVGWSILVVLSLPSWIAAVIFIICNGFKKSANRKSVFVSLAGFIIFFFIWIIGLYLA